MSSNKLAVVLVRGLVNLSPDVRKTLELLRLHKKHACVVIDDNKVNRGMLQRVKDYVTFGEIDESTFKGMLDKRAEMYGKVKVSDSKEKIDTAKLAKDYFAGEIKLRDFEEKGVKPFFRLSPPVKGFERKGIKVPYTRGGVLGNRGESMKDLIAKML